MRSRSLSLGHTSRLWNFVEDPELGGAKLNRGHMVISRKRCSQQAIHQASERRLSSSSTHRKMAMSLLIMCIVPLFGTCSANIVNEGSIMPLAGSGAASSSPAYANSFEIWNMHNRRRFSSSPVTFRVQCETKFGWEVCVTGGCEALGYWDPHHALLLRTDPARYPIWEGVGQLPGGCDIEYKYFVRPREKSELACWESCPNRVVRTGVTEKAILLVTDPDKITPEELERQEMLTSQYFRDWTTLSAPFSSTLIFNTARPQEDFKELLEDEAFQRPCALVFCRDSGTEIFVRDYDTPQIEGLNGNEPLLSTRPEDGAENGEDDEGIRYTEYPNESGWRVGTDVNSLD
uniref:CBM20 domain-containing protein n=1 Tax=Guillardia theta TaxID=55529 RepID=A0A7S4UE86_GUITH|mmetsp:Transcript_44161/g.139318  ORF Transcript_44161/g.139318 Transcript_44161/m.139318 type:complete len:347 (+) Transcript_44161:607-1647(+)